MNNTDIQRIIEYYEDQIQFYSKRAKRAEKVIKDAQRVGLPVQPLYELVYKDEQENVQRYMKKLEEFKKSI